MDIYNVLTERDKDLIKDYIINYADKPDKNEMADLSVILDLWSENKKELYHLFGDKLILEMPISVHEPEAMVRQNVQSFRDKYDSLICEIDEAYHDAVCADIAPSYYHCPFSLFDIQTLQEGSIPMDFIFVLHDKIVKYNAGTKPMKILKKFMEFFHIGEDQYEQICIDYSKIFNKGNLKGTLCLSIHPLDFMTMSDSGENWSSCMSWQEDGGYRRGTIECMNSPYIFVAYLRSNSKTLDNGWNCKKWRSLFALNEDLCINVKGYPYQHNELVEKVLNKIKELNKPDYFIDGVHRYENDYLTVNDYDVETYFSYNTMYNDFDSVSHQVLVSKKLYDNIVNGDTSYKSYFIGGSVTCVNCGAVDEYYRHEGKLVCNNCIDMSICACCGEKHESVYMHQLPNGEMVCDYCFCDNYIECKITGDIVHIEDSKNIYLIPSYVNDERNFLRNNRWIEWISISKEADNSKYFTEEVTECINIWGNDYYFIKTNNVTEEGYKLFGFDTKESIAAYEKPASHSWGNLPF